MQSIQFFFFFPLNFKAGQQPPISDFSFQGPKMSKKQNVNGLGTSKG